MSEKSVVSVRRVVTIAGSFIALLIGSGFATGQEIIQYFSSYGWWGILGVFIMFLMMTFVGVEFITVGYRKKFEHPNDIYGYYVGDKIGKFFDIFSVFFIYLSFIVMLAGAGATVFEQYGLPTWVGATGMAVVVALIAILGLGRIVDVIGNIGPVIVVLSVFVGVSAIIRHFDQAPVAVDVMQNLVANQEVKVASTNWLLAVFSYVGFCLLWLAAFLSQVGANTNSEKEAKAGAFWGSAGFSLGVLAMSLAILFGIAGLGGSQIPALILAREINPTFGYVYSITILLGIFTTAVPLLWTVISRFAKEGTPRYRGLTLVLAAIGWFIAMFVQFDTLVNYVYVLNGYVGAILIVVMAYTAIRRAMKPKEQTESVSEVV